MTLIIQKSIIIFAEFYCWTNEEIIPLMFNNQAQMKVKKESETKDKIL